MSYLNVHYLFSFLVLFSLFQTVRTDSNEVKVETLENSFVKTVHQDVNTTSPTSSVDDEKSEMNELKKQYMRNFNFNETINNNTYRTPYRNKVPQRKPRTLANGTLGFGVECLACTANSSLPNWNCYAGRLVPSVKCADAEHCYIELNPQFIKRGCVLPGRLNRTFICKCPLCNDKPSFDLNHYEYKQLNDWEYDNARLQTPLVGMDLMCKVCETKGTNPMSDKHCRSGKNADYMVCARKQLCYTNIDDETDFVSRGCTDKPLFNSMYFFCNNTQCNSAEFPNPAEKIKLRAEAIHLRDDRDKKELKAYTSFGSKRCTIDFCSMFLIIILTLLQCI